MEAGRDREIERSERIVFSTIYGRGRAIHNKRWFKCIRPEHPAHGGVMLCTVQCRPASACARKSPPRGCTLMKQDKGESLGNFETRRKATRGACYRWHYVVGNATVSMFMFIGQRRHDNHTAAARVCGPVAVDPPPASLGCLSPSSCVRPCTQYHHRHTHPYRLVTSPSSLCRRLCQCLVW